MGLLKENGLSVATTGPGRAQREVYANSRVIRAAPTGTNRAKLMVGPTAGGDKTELPSVGNIAGTWDALVYSTNGIRVLSYLIAANEPNLSYLTKNLKQIAPPLSNNSQIILKIKSGKKRKKN